MFDHQDLRRDPDTGKLTVAIMQAEDELAAIGAIIGAGWAGARSMTATSGPCISLMAEFAGLAYFAEIPCVVWDITRIGPKGSRESLSITSYYLLQGGVWKLWFSCAAICR